MPSAEDLLEHLAFFDDWSERYRYIIDLGKKLEPFPEDERDEAHKVRGCMSQVWFTHRQDGDKLHFLGDSDAAIVRGLIAVLFAAYSDKTPADILAFDLDAYFAELGLESHLSPNRRNGFFSMVERIKGAASAAS
jgi:cysteine desulfuration protein SufE